MYPKNKITSVKVRDLGFMAEGRCFPSRLLGLLYALILLALPAVSFSDNCEALRIEEKRMTTELDDLHRKASKSLISIAAFEKDFDKLFQQKQATAKELEECERTSLAIVKKAVPSPIGTTSKPLEPSKNADGTPIKPPADEATKSQEFPLYDGRKFPPRQKTVRELYREKMNKASEDAEKQRNALNQSESANRQTLGGADQALKQVGSDLNAYIGKSAVEFAATVQAVANGMNVSATMPASSPKGGEVHEVKYFHSGTLRQTVWFNVTTHDESRALQKWLSDQRRVNPTYTIIAKTIRN